VALPGKLLRAPGRSPDTAGRAQLRLLRIPEPAAVGILSQPVPAFRRLRPLRDAAARFVHVYVLTCSPRFIIRRFAHAKMATDDSMSRISPGVIPWSTSGCNVLASKSAGASVRAMAVCTMARSRAVVPAVRGSVNTWAITSLRLANCSKRCACTEVQYTQPLKRDTTAL